MEGCHDIPMVHLSCCDVDIIRLEIVVPIALTTNRAVIDPNPIDVPTYFLACDEYFVIFPCLSTQRSNGAIYFLTSMNFTKAIALGGPLSHDVNFFRHRVIGPLRSFRDDWQVFLTSPR
jgi:hypothetical protein